MGGEWKTVLKDFIINKDRLEKYIGRESYLVIPDGIKIIGEEAFKGCASIEEVLLSSTVTNIMPHAFKGCRKMKKINFPSSLISIGEYAFHRCHSLQYINLPSSVKTIGDCAFLYCDSLKSISMPNVTYLGKQVFLNDINLQTIELSSALEIDCICDVFTGCNKISEIILLNGAEKTSILLENTVERIESLSVYPLIWAIVKDIYRAMEIKDGILIKYLTNVKHVEIPNGIKEIGKSCFFDKKGILSVKLPKTLKQIESKAFRNCIGLEAIEFQTEDVIIKKGAFKNCTTLKTVYLPNGKSYQLEGILEESSEEIPQIVRTIHTQILQNFLISGTTLLWYRGGEEKVVVPDGITIIGEKAFSKNEAIRTVILPNSVEEIHEEAFLDCLLLQKINLPEKINYIGKRAFENCVKLIQIYLPESLTILENAVFHRCKKLSKIEFGSYLKEIKDLAFYKCSALAKVTFPKELYSIKDMAFYGCFSLKEIRLPESIKQLGNNVFTLSGIKSAFVSCDLEVCGSDIFSQCNQLKELVIAEGVRKIGDKFAFHCPMLKEVTLPSTLESIGKFALEDSIYLREKAECKIIVNHILLDARKEEGELVVPEDVFFIAGGACYGNTKITSVKLPKSLKGIDSRAFCGCTSLKEVILPPQITKLEEGVFAYCTSLERVISGDSLEDDLEPVVLEKDLKDDSENESLKSNLTYLSDRAFYGCENLTEVSSERVYHFGKHVFNGCKKLEKIQINPFKLKQTQVNSSELEKVQINTDELERVQTDSYKLEQTQINSFHIEIEEDAFCSTLYLENLRNISPMVRVADTIIDGFFCEGEIRILDGVKSIASFAFAGNDKITAVTAPSSLVNIGEGAFLGCKNLKKIYFSSEINFIGKRAFEKCISIIEFSCTVKEIGEEAFAYCTGLTYVALEKINTLKKETFCGCIKLERLECSSLSVIEDFCFSGCDSLKSFDFTAIKQIGIGAFFGCNSLNCISLSERIDIKAHAFEECGRLKEIILTSPKLKFGSYAFSGCSALSKIYIGGEEYLLEEYTILFHPQIPEIVKAIYASALSCFTIEEYLDSDVTYSISNYKKNGQIIFIPNGIKRIERETFKDAVELKEVFIGKTVEYIGSRAFYGTAWLEAQSKISPMVIINHILIDGTKCKGEVTIPEEVSVISGWAFANCFGLTKVIFSSEKTMAEEYAFRNCIYLKEVTDTDGKTYYLNSILDCNLSLPPKIQQIFKDCYNCFKTDENGVLIECTGNISNLTLPDKIYVIGEYAFAESNLLTYLTCSQDVHSIKKAAFKRCKWLVSVKNAVSVTRIEEFAFSECTLLESIELSEKLQFIGKRAFEHCVSLTNILIPEGVICIPERAFYRCKSLKQISFPSTLKRIEKEAFAFCSELVSVTIPENIEFIDTDAFLWCLKLNNSFISVGHFYNK